MKRKRLWFIIGVIVLIIIIIVAGYMIGGFGQQTGFESGKELLPTSSPLTDLVSNINISSDSGG